MNAPITGVHRKLAEEISKRNGYDPSLRHNHAPIEGDAQLRADSEARAVAAVSQWHPASVRPQPSSPEVKCDAYLAITLGSERPCVLTYIYASAQWTQGEGDTQRITCWGHIVPVDWLAERDQLRTENEAIRHELAVARNAECLARTQLDLARAERDAERARLDWLQNVDPNSHQWSIICDHTDIRAAIDAAMKEGK